MARETGKSGGRAWRVVFAIAAIVFVACVAALGVIGFSYFQGQQKYNDIANAADFSPDDVERAKLSEVKVDWDSLREANGDTVAWVYVPHTAINYPVVQADDNDYYLTHDFDGVQGWLANFGAVFMDYRNNPDGSDQAYFIYGHHMNDGSMFSDLAGFLEQERFDECRTMYLLTPAGNYKLRTFAVLHVGADDTLVQMSFADGNEMAEYVQDKIDRSAVDPGSIKKADEIDKVFALATCDNLASDGRYVVYAYIDEESADGLSGDVGVGGAGADMGFVNDLMIEDSGSSAGKN